MGCLHSNDLQKSGTFNLIDQFRNKRDKSAPIRRKTPIFDDEQEQQSLIKKTQRKENLQQRTLSNKSQISFRVSHAQTNRNQQNSNSTINTNYNTFRTGQQNRQTITQPQQPISNYNTNRTTQQQSFSCPYRFQSPQYQQNLTPILIVDNPSPHNVTFSQDHSQVQQFSQYCSKEPQYNYYQSIRTQKQQQQQHQPQQQQYIQQPQFQQIQQVQQQKYQFFYDVPQPHQLEEKYKLQLNQNIINQMNEPPTSQSRIYTEPVPTQQDQKDKTIKKQSIQKEDTFRATKKQDQENIDQLIFTLNDHQQKLMKTTSKALLNMKSERLNTEDKQVMNTIFTKLDKSSFLDSVQSKNSIQQNNKDLHKLYENMTEQLALLGQVVQCLEQKMEQKDSVQVKQEMERFAIQLQRLGAISIPQKSLGQSASSTQSKINNFKDSYMRKQKQNPKELQLEQPSERTVSLHSSLQQENSRKMDELIGKLQQLNDSYRKMTENDDEQSIELSKSRHDQFMKIIGM